MKSNGSNKNSNRRSRRLRNDVSYTEDDYNQTTNEQTSSTSPSSSSSPPVIASKTIFPTSTTIQHLNKQYIQLTKVEKILVKEYEDLVKEEKILRIAIRESKETGREKMMRERKEREENALKRLEEALMMDSSHSSSSSSSSSSEDVDEDEAAPTPTPVPQIVGRLDGSKGGETLLSQVLLDSDDDSSSDDEQLNEENILRML